MTKDETRSIYVQELGDDTLGDEVRLTKASAAVANNYQWSTRFRRRKQITPGGFTESDPVEIAA